MKTSVSNFRNAKVGDKVWFGLQEGVVTDISGRQIDEYPIRVGFFQNNIEIVDEFFNINGCCYNKLQNSQLFSSRPTFHPKIQESATEQEVLMAILMELREAQEIHPDYPTDRFRQLAILTEEIGEVAMAVNDIECGDDTVDHLREELLQSAAMCVRMILNL